MSQALTRPGVNRDIRSVLEKMSGQFAMALPKIVPVERFLRVAITSINKNPKLLACTKESLLACLLDCAALGIEPDGRRAHLIPYKDKCTLILDYKGIAELVRRSGDVSSLKAGIVYPGDEFEYQFGTGAFLKHRPNLNRGETAPIAVYSYVKLKDGEEDFDVMGIPEVNRVRDRSQGYRYSVSQGRQDNPWMTDYDEMAKKTVFRRHSKMLPLSPELREKVEHDDEPLTEQERFAAAKPIQSQGMFGPAGVEPEVVEEQEVETTILPDGDVVNVIHEPESEQPKPEAPPRKRRTKAEMEAEHLARTDPKAATELEHAAKPTPPRATPLEGLRNLIGASPIDEAQLTRHLVNKMVLEPHQKIDDLSQAKLTNVIEEFMNICAEILEPDPKKEKAPY